MEVRPGYKQTEVGVIPEDWEVLSVSQIGQIKTGPFGTLLKASEYSGHDGVPLISVGEVGDGTFRVTEHTPRVPDGVVRRLPQYVLRTGDIVFGRKGAVDRSALVSQRENGWFLGSDGISVRPLATCHPPYLAAQLRSGSVKSWLIQNAIGTTMASLNQNILSRVLVPYAPGPEQRAIAAALSDVDALLGGLDRLIAKKRDLKQAAMQQLLTGQTRLPGFHGQWELKRISDIASPTSEKNSAGEKLPVLTCSKHFGFMDSLGFFKNQVFSKDLSTYKIIRRGEIGYPANHVEEGSIGLQDCYEVALVSPIYVVFGVAEGINSYFLHRLLKLDAYRQRFKTATTSSVDRRGSLRWPAFSEITVALPPTKDEQTAIAAVLSDMDAELAALEVRRDKIRALKQAMMQELLTGRTRLV
ncbi:MAG: restriction endonuclease subunit S [Burkholderiales bacterium]|nr:restriction endonuclease subunit S [Burkholderiales bacterium]